MQLSDFLLCHISAALEFIDRALLRRTLLQGQVQVTPQAYVLLSQLGVFYLEATFLLALGDKVLREGFELGFQAIELV